LTRINIHVFFNEGQKILLEHYFAPSLKDDWQLVVHPIRKLDDDQSFGTRGFKDIIHQKMEILVSEILAREERSYGFILSDIDIQFFKPCGPIVLDYLGRYDIVFQRENPHTAQVNTGFMAMRATPEVINFWKRIESELKESLDRPLFVNEQSIANARLEETPKLSWGIFPDEIWAWSNHRCVPTIVHLREICLHHANCTAPTAKKTSLELKIQQLDLVKKAVCSRTGYLTFVIKYSIWQRLTRIVRIFLKSFGRKEIR